MSVLLRRTLGAHVYSHDQNDRSSSVHVHERREPRYFARLVVLARMYMVADRGFLLGVRTSGTWPPIRS